MRITRLIIAIYSLLILMACTDFSAVESKRTELEKEEEKLKDLDVQESNSDANQAGADEMPAEEEVSLTEPQYKINANNWTVEPINQANSKVVLLTIDDAPDKNALEMARILKKLSAPAIFFVNGHFIDTPEEAEVLKEIHELGFAIGNHTYSHLNLASLPEAQQYKEIVGLNDRVEEIIGERPKFFRAPFGSNTDYSRKIAEGENMVLMNWTYGYDWEEEYQSKEALTDVMVNSPYLVKGANLLMHDRKWTKEALEDIVKGLKNKGFTPVDPALISIEKE
ncbi:MULTISPECIES: polysaccharide deacetylase family protein [unclassified Cytobacillus]|uniref:polysaccharide deacetylase family protein n=1 Tax=unclassified Cytobacillus TaxID=2675268 RepID=UPI00203DDE38|nr:polysaccharide deacetylase family protein [Cytobacillus sp. AMY 15.2]MCM3094431.1 polysaccharide deacetylase family protein [Cytobacillus sp. AMY 15.2]